MRNKRFIFTIDEKTKQYIDEIARQNRFSKSKALKHIIDEQKFVIPLTNHDTSTLSFEHTFNPVDIYSTPDIGKIISDPNFIDFISNDDADFLIFVIDDLLIQSPDNDGLKLLYAKLLKHRGMFTESKHILGKINTEYNLDKLLLLFSIAIQMGEIAEANHLMILCHEAININLDVCQNLKEQFYILSAEFYWINNGVVVAESYVDKLLLKYSKTNKPLFLGKLYCLKGEFLRDRGNYVNAEVNYKKALQYFEKNSFEGNYLARIFKGLGSVYKNRGNFKLAYDHLLIALNIAKKFGDKITESGVLASVAGLYFTENKMEQGVRALKNKVQIGKDTNSLRETFYANYDLCLATIEKGDVNSARDIIENNTSNAVKFKREYYIKMWRGYIEAKSSIEKGINIIKSCKIDALDANEDKKVHLADYLLAATYLQNPNTKSEADKIITHLLNNPSVSGQLKSNINYLIKNPDKVKAI
jgi:tetratricopeptide (TPR) repeat protein